MTLDQALDEYLAAWEMMRRLGFPAADLFLSTYTNVNAVCLELHRADGPPWRWQLAELPEIPDEEAVRTAYAAACHRWMASSEDERQRILRGSAAWRGQVGLLLTLQQAGLLRRDA